MSLPKTKTLLEFFEGHPERWTQHMMRRDASGGRAERYSKDICQVDLIGAADYIGVLPFNVTEACREKFSKSASDFNDSCADFDEFMDGLRKLGL